MANLLVNNFDAETTGALPAGWTDWGSGDDIGHVTVQAAPAGLSGKAMRILPDTFTSARSYGTFTRQTSGIVTFAAKFKTGSTVAANYRWLDLNILDGPHTTGDLVTRVLSLDSRLILQSKTVGSFLIIPGLTTNTVYTFTGTINWATKKLTSFVLNGTTYDNSGAGYALDSSLAGVDRVNVDAFSASAVGGDYQWLDDLSITNATVTFTDTPSGSVGVAGSANDSWTVPGPTAGTIALSGTVAGVACGSTKYGGVAMVYTEAGVRPTTNGFIVERSADAGASWSVVTDHCTITSPLDGSGHHKILDRRPQYAPQAASYGGQVRYRVTPKLGAAVGDPVTTGDVVAQTDKPAVRAQHFANVRTNFDAQPLGYVESSTTGTVYVGEIVNALAWAYSLEGNPADLGRISSELYYIQTTLCNADNLLQFPGLNDLIYIDHHGRTALQLALASRQLQKAGETTVSNALLAQADLMAKAIFQKLNNGSPEVTERRVGWQPGAYAARANSTAVSLGAIRTASPDNGYTYRCMQAGTTAAAQPTMPTTDLATVVDGTVVWRCEPALIPVQRDTTYAVGQIIRPSTANGRTYRCTTAGHTHATTEPTYTAADGATVTDGTAVFTETSVTATFLYHEFQPTAPYSWTSNSIIDTNQQSEQAALFAALLTDPRSTTFYPAGTYRTRAQAVVDGISAITTTLQGSGGRVAIGDPNLLGSTHAASFDTLYGSYTCLTWAAIKRLQGDRHPQMSTFLNAALDWMENGYSNETAPPLPGGIPGVHYTNYWTVGGPYELSYREAGAALLGRAVSTSEIPYSGAFWDETTGRWGVYTPLGNTSPQALIVQAPWAESYAYMAAIGLGPTYSDEPAGSVSVSGLAAHSNSDSPSGLVAVTGSSGESYSVGSTFSDSPSGLVVVTGTSGESYSVGSTFSDSPSGLVTVAGASVDVPEIDIPTFISLLESYGAGVSIELNSSSVTIP
jgi:hypothetical protein